MSPDPEHYLALLQRQLFLLRALAEQLLSCRKEFVAMDLDGIYRHIAEQEELCRQLQSIGLAIDSMRKARTRQLESGTDGEPANQQWTARFAAVMREMQEARNEVCRLSRIHAAYLRRSGRTVQVLLNFLGNYALFYARPEPPAPAILQRRS